MQASQTPTLVPLAFAANGTKNTIPEASQIGITNGAASLNDGFPPLCSTPIAAGGVPPAGADFNGILNLITASIRWAHGGGRYTFSSTFAADANVSGYPQGAQLMSADLLGTWISLNDSNTDNPDTGAGTKWVPGHTYGITPIAGLAAANVTLTPAQAAKSKITLAGTLTANVQIIFPTWTKEWEVVNNTTGAFTVTAKTSAGTGIALAAGQQKITGDGTNITQPAESIAAAALPTQPAQLQQVGDGQCRLTVASSTSVTLIPFGGNNLVINGIPQQIPAAGVSASNSGLAASTDYYAYAQMVSGSMVLNLSTTGYTRQSNGVVTKTGDTTQRFVGMVGTNASTQFADSPAVRLCCSFFNRYQKSINTGSFTGSTSSATLVSTGNVFTGMYLAGDNTAAILSGYAAVNAANGYGQMQLQLDNGTNTGTTSFIFSPVSNANGTICSQLAGTPAADGRHTITSYAANLGGSGSLSWTAAIMGSIFQ